MISEELFAYLSSDPGVSALVGTRIYPERLPQEPTYPCLLYLRVDITPDYSQDGEDETHNGRWQISAFAKTYSDSQSLVSVVRQAMRGWQAVSGCPAYFLNQQPIPQPQTQVYQQALDFDLYWRE